jgi:predicted PurR-regulated permease PerM
LARFATFALMLWVVYTLFVSVESVLVPVLFALGIAYLLDPMIDHLEDRGYSRTRAILLFMAVGLGSMALFILFLYPTVSQAVGKVMAGLPRLIHTTQDQVLPWIEAQTGFQAPETLSQGLADYGETVRAQLPGLLDKATAGAGDIWARTGSLAASLLNLVMIPIFTFYFLRDFDRMTGRLQDLVPDANRDWILERIRRMDHVVGAWFRGQVEVALILAGLYAIGLAIVFGVSGVGIAAGIAIGLLAGLLNIIPYFGFIVGFGLSVLLVALEAPGWAPLLAVVAVFALVQTLEGYVITPRIVGEAVGLSPVVVIIALLVGGEVLGLLGVLLALPVAGIIRVLLPDMVAWYKSTDVYLGVDSKA